MKDSTSAAGAAVQDSQLIVILDDDDVLTGALAEALSRAGRTIITCNDLESAELMVERLKPSFVVSDVRLSGQFAFEGLDFVRFVRQFSPETRVLLMTGDAPEALQVEAAERGAVGCLQKPFEVAELNAMLGRLSRSALPAPEFDAPIIRMPLLDEILNGDSLNMFLQPIVLLAEGNETYGYEALARYDGNSLLHNPEVLFLYAKQKQRIADLEMACASRALHAAARLTGSHALFLNIHPQVLSEGSRVRELLVRDCSRLGIPFERIVLEITEQGSLNAGPILFENVEQLRQLGVRFAFDDLGVAYSHLPLIDKVRPSFLKISQEFGTAFERDSMKLKIVMNLQSLARDFDCTLILEGIEEASTAEMAARMGIQLAQGYLFARPAPAASFAA